MRWYVTHYIPQIYSTRVENKFIAPRLNKNVLHQGWLSDVGHNSWWHMHRAQHQIRKDGIIQTSPVVVLKLIEAERRIYASVNLPSLLQTMACRLVGAKPLSEAMQEYCQLDS